MESVHNETLIKGTANKKSVSELWDNLKLSNSRHEIGLFEDKIEAGKSKYI